jgi:hypothetical protein
MVWVPAARVESVAEACPRLLTAIATGLVPFAVKVIAPVGVRLEEGWLTVAVTMSAWPSGEGLREVATPSVVGAGTRVTVTATDDDEVADVYQAWALALGKYSAVIDG